MSDRFFVEFPIVGDTAVLTGQEAIHLARVLRAKVGDVVLLFDGSGAEFKARVERVKKDSVECAIVERYNRDRELKRSIAMGVALPKGDRQRWLVEKLTELGVISLTPLIADRSVVQPDEHSVIRLKRFVIEASKQCGRNHLMAIHSPARFDDFVTAADPDAARVIAHPPISYQVSLMLRPALTIDQKMLHQHRRRLSEFLSAAEMARRLQRKVVFAVGPEGGFNEEELESACQAGFLPVDLGQRTLRTETAAIALASVAAMTDETDTRSERNV